VLILRDVLEFGAAEVADLLDTSVAAVNSALQRARAGLSGAAEHEVAEPADTAARAAIDRYITAFESADVPGLVRLLTDDVVLEMPPVPVWYQGRDHYGRFMDRVFATRPDWRMLPITANGQPAAAAYCRGDGGYRPHSVQVFTVTPAGIARNVVFADLRVFPVFELPPVL
jgi:RNA polymerase sigma-70 factor (ECF subfamily)